MNVHKSIKNPVERTFSVLFHGVSFTVLLILSHIAARPRRTGILSLPGK